MTEYKDINFSDTSINTFTGCMHRYYLQCMMGLEPDEPSLDLEFGKLSHEVLHKVFDEIFYSDKYDRPVSQGQIPYEAIRAIVGICAPQELEYEELKEKFKITSWWDYYTAVVIQFLKDYKKEKDAYYSDNCELMFETRFEMSAQDLEDEWGCGVSKNLVGVVDFFMLHKDENGKADRATIIDFKFSNYMKGQADFDQNSQLYIYTLLVCHAYNLNAEDVRIAYVSIPKTSPDRPRILKNGTLSQDKSQNVTAEDYRKAIIEQHGENHPTYNAEAGGFYYDIVQALTLNKTAYTNIENIDGEIYARILHSLMDAMETITVLQDNVPTGDDGDDWLYPRKFNSFQCKGCPYIKQCKPWLTTEI